MEIPEFKEGKLVPKNFTGHCFLTRFEVHCYYKNGKLHREDGPAYLSSLTRYNREELWFFEGKLHRLDGPAVKAYRSTLLVSTKYFLDGRRYNQESDYISALLSYRLKSILENNLYEE